MHTGTQPRRRQNSGLLRAVKVAKGQAALGRLLDRRQGTIWEWLKTGRVSAEDAIQIEKATGVPAEQINGALAEFAKMRGLPTGKVA